MTLDQRLETVGVMGSVPGAGASVPCPAMDTDGMTGLCFIDHHLHPHIALPTMGEYVSLDYLVLGGTR